MAALAQYRELRMLNPGQVGRLALRQIDTEPLTGNGIAVLETGIAHVHFLDPGGLGQLLSDERGVGAVLFDVQPEVFALTGGWLQRQLGHNEILVEAFQGGAGAAGRISIGPLRQGRVLSVVHARSDGTSCRSGRAVRSTRGSSDSDYPSAHLSGRAPADATLSPQSSLPPLDCPGQVLQMKAPFAPIQVVNPLLTAASLGTGNPRWRLQSTAPR